MMSLTCSNGTRIIKRANMAPVQDLTDAAVAQKEHLRLSEVGPRVTAVSCHLCIGSIARMLCSIDVITK